MGHNLYVYPAPSNQLTDYPGKIIDGHGSASGFIVGVLAFGPDRELRMAGISGKNSKLYELLEAQNSNNIDSGNGDIRAYPPIRKWPKPPDRNLITSLPTRERIFWNALEAYPHGFIILFE